MPSKYYSNQPEFGTDPYSFVIGQPRPEREQHKAMASWSESHYHPSYGTTTVARYDWQRSNRSVSFGNVNGDGVYKLSITYLDERTGVVEDVHDHYILGGSLLEKVKQDFNQYVIGSWQTARRIHHEFPHHTIAKLSGVLDPTKDLQPEYMYTWKYIEVQQSNIKGYSDMCLYSAQTPKGSSRFTGTIYYSSDGTVKRTISHITRNTYRDFIVITFIGGRFDTEQIEYIYDSKYGVIREMSKVERRRLMTEKERWEREQLEEKYRTEQRKKREQRAREVAQLEDGRALLDRERRERSERIDQYIIENYKRCTRSEIANAFGISVKAVEHRVSRLRKKGRIPLSKDSDVYREQSQIEEEERIEREKRREWEVKAADARKRREEEERQRRDATTRENEERAEKCRHELGEGAWEYWSILSQQK